jgi:hypothetical protein
MADIASPIKTLGNFPAVDPTVAAIGTADQIADGETKVSMTAVERGKVDTIDNSGTRWVYGKRIAYASMGLDGRMAFAVTEDGYHYAKYAIRLAVGNGLSWSRGPDGFHELKFGAVEGALPLGVAGDVVDTTGLGYLGGKKVLRAVADQTGRTALAITEDGYIRGKLGVVLTVSNGLKWVRGADGLTTLAFGTAEGALPLGTAGDVVDTSSQRYYLGQKVLRAWGDQSGRMALMLLQDGRVIAPKLVVAPQPSSYEMLDAPNHIFDTALAGSVIQIFRSGKNGAARVQATASGNNFNPRLSDDQTRLIYMSDRTGSVLPWHQPVGGGAEHPLFAQRAVVGVGDSLTFGQGADDPATQAAIAVVGATLDVPFVNLGRGGYSAPAIAAYIGAVDPVVTMQDNQIVSGVNNITAIDFPFMTTNTTSVSGGQTRTIAGITGLVNKLSGGAWPGSYTFTPNGGQTLPVACPPGTPVKLPANKNSEKIAFIRVGRNLVDNATRPNFDTAWSDEAFAATQQIVGWLKPLVKYFVILPVLNSNTASEYEGASNYVGIMAHNARLAAAWPDNYLDDLTPLVESYDPGNSQDVTNYSRRVPPASKSADGLHLNTVGYAFIANLHAGFVTAKGWLANPLLAPSAA